MKYFIVFVLSALMFSASANAARGNAAIPNFITGGGTWTFLYFSNITNADVEVEVDLYNMDGTMMQDNNVISSGVVRLYPTTIAQYTENDGNTAKFTIPAHQTVSLKIYSTDHNQGHGFVRWSQEGTRRKAMLAHGRVYRGQTSREFSWSVPINNGKSF